MTRTTVNIATLYSSAQCVLSVVGSVGVILLFAGIPQLIYSPTISVANLMTFLLGAVLITTMVAGNSFLNYKYRKFTRNAQANQRDANSSEAAAESRTEAEDKPPSYEAILSLDGLPPDYFTVLNEKPPKYEDIAKVFSTGSILPAVPLDENSSNGGGPNTTEGSPDSPQSTSPPKDISTATEGETAVTTSALPSSSSSSSKKKSTKDDQNENTTHTSASGDNEAQDTQDTHVHIVHTMHDITHSESEETSTTTLQLRENPVALDLRENPSSSDLRESES